MSQRNQQVLGWSAVGLSAVAAGFWAVWGVIENFHEGWYYASIWKNVGLMLAQYLLPMEVFVGAALIAIRWPRIGGGVHLAAAVVAAWFFRHSSSTVIYPFVVAPLVMMGISYWLGRPQPRQWAMAGVVVLPAIAVLVCGAEPAVRVSKRLDDGNLSSRHITSNGVDLIWAPQGPGWPRDGVNWEQAVRRCRYLSEDGTSLADSPQDVWRLPTVEEAVGSMQRHGHDSGGSWDTASQRASYRQTPDKESPLWDVHSPVIYWWTATEAGTRQSYIIAYDGKVWRRPKAAQWTYLGFRAVKGAKN